MQPDPVFTSSSLVSTSELQTFEFARKDQPRNVRSARGVKSTANREIERKHEGCIAQQCLPSELRQVVALLLESVQLHAPTAHHEQYPRP